MVPTARVLPRCCPSVIGKILQHLHFPFHCKAGRLEKKRTSARQPCSHHFHVLHGSQRTAHERGDGQQGSERRTRRDGGRVCIGAQSARRGPGRHTVRVLTPRACGVGHRIGQACTSMLVYNGGSVSVLCLPLVLRFAVNTASLAPQSLHAPREQVQRSRPTLPPGGICWRSRPPSASASCLSGQPAGRSGHIITIPRLSAVERLRDPHRGSWTGGQSCGSATLKTCHSTSFAATHSCTAARGAAASPGC